MSTPESDLNHHGVPEDVGQGELPPALVPEEIRDGPPNAKLVYLALNQHPEEWVTCKEVAALIGSGYTSGYHALLDLESAGVVERHKGFNGYKHVWRLCPGTLALEGAEIGGQNP